MKLLVIGIDGGTKEIIEGMPMPFTQSLFKNANSKTLQEDPLSRGWAEALTGCHASENKGFYISPYADKTYDFNHGYSKKEMESSSPNPPLWTMLNDQGCSVGIINVPTTGPAAEVDGFLISGGGGGLSSIGGVPKGMFYPESIEESLIKNKYIFDIRLSKKETTISQFIKKIADAETTQKQTFLELANKHQPDFGFFCIRMITEVQYLTRYEIKRCIEGINSAKENNKPFVPENTVQETLMDYYQQVDDHIKEVFESIQPQEFLFISDHSTALFNHDLNLDVWLANNQFLTEISPLEKLYQRFYRSWKLTRFLNKLGIKRAFQKKFEKRPTREMITQFKPTKTKAFGTFFDSGNFAGIFINDAKRFAGPVADSEDVDKLVDEICTKFNADNETQKHNLQAVPYRRRFKESKFFDLMPDIQIEKPDTTYCSGRNWAFISENPNLKPFEDKLEGVSYPHTGLKGTDPLFVYSKNLESCIDKNDSNDLRMAYRLISRFFETEK